MLFDEYKGGDNGQQQSPQTQGIAVIVDHMPDENNDDATDIDDVKHFLK